MLGLFVGLAGGSFSVGTPYVARWFPRKQQGFAMGVYGAGNSGAAVNKFVAPALLVAFGWAMVPQVYAAIMLGTALLFWIGSYSDPHHLVDSKITWRQQLVALKDPKVWKYCQYYSIVFGGYVAMSLWMVQYYVGEFGLDIRAAALLAACFSLPGGVLRAVGGWLSDKYGAHSDDVVGAVGELDLPVPAVLSADRHDDRHDRWPEDVSHRPQHVGVHRADVHPRHRVGVRQGVGVQVHLRRVSENIGVISGVVGLAGGIGGFILPIMFGALMDLTGIRSSHSC